ncbi:MAG: transporter substrate-binding domain-containing protein [Acidimicrobiia bacterium]|nr:transporter substrate-binding domain-containing protein [Acidimicrobiia bacterium]
MRVVALLLLLLAAPQLAPTGTLRAAFLATNPVQARIDPQTGAISGPAADMARELARRLGVQVSLMPEPDAAAVIARVLAKQADIGFLAVEAERATQVDFSEPYLIMGNGYLVRADSDIQRSADVDRAGITVGAVKGQTQQIHVSANLENARVRVFDATPSHEALVKMLVSGELQAFAANRQRMGDTAATSPRVRILADDFLKIGQAIVVPRGDTARLKEINTFVLDARKSGFVQQAITRAKLTGMEVAR